MYLPLNKAFEIKQIIYSCDEATASLVSVPH